MSLHGISSWKFDIESPADEFFRFIVEDINTSKLITTEKVFECSEVDREKKILTIQKSGSLISEGYKKVAITITVTPKEDQAKGSHVAWTAKFEKISHDIDNPYSIINYTLKYLMETDKILKSHL